MKTIFKFSIAAGCLLALSASPALAADTSQLFVQQASKGKLERVGKQNYRLELAPMPSHTISFSDRPGRQGGTLRTKKFVSKWSGYGFQQDPPNAALSIDTANKKRDVFLFTLSNPRIRNDRLTYTAKPLKGEPGSALKRFQKKVDRVRELDFGRASLFIDPTNQATPVRLEISSNGLGSDSLIQIEIRNDLVWSIDGPSTRSNGLQIVTGPAQQLPFVEFNLNSQNLLISASPAGVTPGSFVMNLYVVGSEDFLEGVATIGPGWTVNATVNGVTETWNSGNIAVPLV